MERPPLLVSQRRMEGNLTVKTVNRLVEILDSFSSRPSGWSLVELSTHLGLPKSTLHRFLVALETHGILQRDPRDRRWRLGYRPLLWGRLAANHGGLHLLARPVMESLAAATGETVLLTVYQNGEVVCMWTLPTLSGWQWTLGPAAHPMPELPPRS